MNKEKVQNTKKATKTASVFIKTTPQVKKWMKQNNISATKVFEETLKELGCPHIK